MSLRKDLTVGPVIALVLTIVVLLVVFVIIPIMQSTVSLKISDGIFRARTATSVVDRDKAFSNTDKLEDNQAVLLAFPSEDKWSVAVKDIRVPADIVWLDAEKKVVYALTNISPDEFSTKEYYPKSAAKYMIEFTAGTVNSKSINKGSKAVFDIKEEDIE
ncbi:MAG: DUF192 domain-containing protein [Candidatus Saccharimonadaceae bacterium]|nr:DUF192 domain-containing protein [Candidatus Saccharimonadaceae bacterium]